jgi:hypothetical protein
VDTQRLAYLAQIHAAVDYGSTASVHAGNKAADEIRTTLLAALDSPGGTDQVIGLLGHSVIASWPAYMALERATLTEFQRARCLSVIRSLAAGNGVESIGAKAWLMHHGCEA